MKEIKLLGCKMHPITMEETIKIIEEKIIKGEIPIKHAVINSAKLIKMLKDPELKKSVESCDIINIDGIGVVWAARILGYEVPERVTGIDLFLNLINLCKKKGFSVFLLGGTEEVIRKVVRNLKKNHPNLKIVGFHHGYFWNYEEDLVKSIQQKRPDFIFIGISTPKKEKFIAKWSDILDVKFIMGVGGSFDVIAGKVKRAPKWVQKVGLEWLYRFLQEPKRMWKRAFMYNMIFIWLITKEIFKSKFRKGLYKKFVSLNLKIYKK